MMVTPTPISIVKTVKEASTACRSFLDGVVIFFVTVILHKMPNKKLPHKGIAENNLKTSSIAKLSPSLQLQLVNKC